jgi:hypothetical protein
MTGRGTLITRAAPSLIPGGEDGNAIYPGSARLGARDCDCPRHPGHVTLAFRCEPKRPQQRHAAVAAYCFGDAGAGDPGKGEDQRTILPSLNLTV